MRLMKYVSKMDQISICEDTDALPMYPQLATQFYASIRYISSNHPDPQDPPSPTRQTPPPASAGTGDAATTDATNQSGPPEDQQQPPQQIRPIPSPAQFTHDQRELARDLILKEQQIEYLISVLPGIGTSEREQLDRLTVLRRQLREAEEERKRAVADKDEVLKRLDDVILNVRRV